MFSLEKNSKGWSLWQKNLSETLKAGNIFGSEGLAINMSVYIDDLETEFLPLNCNWEDKVLQMFFDFHHISVNDWSSVELYFQACNNGKLGITQTIGPGYKITSKVNWLFGKLAIIKSQNFKHAIKSKIGTDKARKLAFAPHINIGVFSLEKNSKGWSLWQKNLSETLKAGNIFGSEGLAINMSVYIDDLETEFLPLNCNWEDKVLQMFFDFHHISVKDC